MFLGIFNFSPLKTSKVTARFYRKTRKKCYQTTKKLKKCKLGP